MRWQMLCFYSKELHYDRVLSIIKAECTRVICEEVDKAIDDNVA